MLDPSISLAVKPIQLDSPVENYGKALGLRSLMLHNQSAEQSFADNQRLRDLLQSGGANDPASLRDMLYKSGIPGAMQQGVALDKDVLANKAEELKARKAQLDNVAQQHAIASSVFGSLGENPSLDQVGQAFQYLQSKGLQPDMSDMPKTQAEVPAWMQKVTARGQTVGEQLQQANMEWEHQWKLSQPQSDLGRTVSDVERMQRPGFEFNSVNGLGLKAPGITSTSAAAMPESSAQRSGSQAPAGTLIDPNNAKIALWKAAGNHIPEGQVPFVDSDGTVKTKTDPGWLQAKNEIARNSATVVNNNIGTKSFNEKFGALQAGQIEAEQKKAQGAADTIMTMHKVRDAIDSGVFVGGKTADAKLAITQVLQGFHIPLPQNWNDLAVNSSEFKSFVGSQLLQHAKDLGTNPSNTDAARIDKIIGQLGTDPKALVDVMDFNEGMARRSIDRFNGHLTEAQKNAQSSGDGSYGFDMTIPQPPVWQSSKPAKSKVNAPGQPKSAPNASVDSVSGAIVKTPNMQPQKTIKWEDLK